MKLKLPTGMTVEDIMHRNELLRAEVIRLHKLVSAMVVNLPKEELVEAMFEEGWECRKLPASEWMHKYWGPKCADFEPQCARCKAWTVFDKTGKTPNADNLDDMEAELNGLGK
jgi:hypothetical protein